MGKRKSSGGGSFGDGHHRYSRHVEPVLAVEEVDASLPPAEFWARFVSQRRPALLRGHPTDAAWRASSRWSDAYLASQAVSEAQGASIAAGSPPVAGAAGSRWRRRTR